MIDKSKNTGWINNHSMSNQLIIILMVFLIGGCNIKTDKNQVLSSDSIKTSMEFQPSVEKNPEIIEYIIVKDTLRIVTTSNFLYYPFGSYKSEKEISLHYPFMTGSVESKSFIHDSSSKINLYNLNFRTSHATFILDDEKNKMEIVDATISDYEILLERNIRLGITKSDFISRFSGDITIVQIKDIKVIELVSGLLGIWHYYHFDKDILSSIFICTDYQISTNHD